MTGGSLPAQTWHDIMVVAHQGVEVKEIPGIGMGTKLPQPALPANVAANGAARVLETKPGPPPVLTKRGADILVRVERAARRGRQGRGQDLVQRSEAAGQAGHVWRAGLPGELYRSRRRPACAGAAEELKGMIRQNVNRLSSERMRGVCADMLKQKEALQVSDEAGSTGI